MITEVEKEVTLCAWCGNEADNTEKRVRFNGEYICLTCYALHKWFRKENYLFWKGVKKHG